MSFRVRLYVCLVVAVLVGAVAEVAFDTLETREQVEEATDRAISDAVNQADAWLTDRFSASLDEFLDLAEASAEVLVASHVEVSLGENVVSTAGNPAALRREGVVRETRAAVGGHVVTVVVDPAPYASILYRRLRSDLVTDVVQLALSLAAVSLLAGWLQRPVRRLTRQVDAMSGQRLPEPVPVPEGNDEFAELAAAFNRMTENVKESFRRETAFTTYASHELRTPLSAIQLQLESLRIGAVERHDAADVLERNVHRMERVLDALLSLTRVGRQTEDSAHARRVVDDVVDSLDAPDRLRVKVVRGQGAEARVASPSLVAQAVKNLLDNALTYTEGDVSVAVETRLHVVRISVRDHGPGVPEDAVELVMRPYVRVGGRSGGTGLGLAFVKQVADAIRGEVHLHNLDDGFEVELELPEASTR